MDAEAMRAHERGLDLMGAYAGAPESIRALANAIASQFDGAENVPSAVIVALGRVAMAREQVEASESRWHAEARDSTQRWHAAEARANNAQAAFDRVQARLVESQGRFNALHGRYSELTGALAIVAAHAKESV